MSTYENLHGTRVNVVSTNPSNPKDGEVWYNSTLGQLKGYVLGTGTWSNGGTLGSGRYGTGIGQSQNAATLAGMQGPPTGYNGTTENYDGTSWTSSGSISVASYRIAGAGTQTAGMGAGGYIPGSGRQSRVEHYNGSSWSSGGAMPSAVQFQSGSGPQTAAFYTSGNYPGGDTGATLRYNGSSWTSGASLNTGTRQAATIGAAAAQTACLNAGGYNPPSSPADSDKVEEYDGSSWTNVSVLPLGIHASGSSGISTNALVFGGSAPSYVKTMAWDGTAWSEQGNQTTSIRRVHNGGGGTDSAIAMGGNPNGATTEEFSAGVVETKTLTTS
tara:strand:- start:51 stop:1037 length:987 start_codon:yes stop_codon:yes gene_type:complete